MRRVGFSLFAAVLLILPAGVPDARPAAANATPDLHEVYDLVRTHLDGISDAELNRAAVSGLLEQLGPKVSLVGESAKADIVSQPLLIKSEVFDGPVGYMRIGRVDGGLARDIAAACKNLSSTNELKGLVLDVRFAGGQDYAEVGAVADLFLSKEQPLLDWGAASARSRTKSDALKLPIAVLVNRQTEAAAEALAAVLRETGAGLLLGTNTAGRAMIAQEFPLKNGQRLRVATAGIKLGSGEVLSARGVKPDIEVTVDVEEERTYLADPFKELASPSVLAATPSSTNIVANGTNATRRRGLSEADLVRARREGTSLEFTQFLADASPERTDPEKPVVRDPVLARALDLIKGLAVMRQFRTP